MKKIYNFGAGPAKIPEEVLERAHQEFFNWKASGISILEVGHRTKIFEEFAFQTEQNLRLLLDIPQNYKILFLSGGATSQFAMVPMNLLTSKQKADYIVTGVWSEKAALEAQKYGKINIVASSKTQNFITIPFSSSWNLQSDAAYVYYTHNETIGGVQFHHIPEVTVPLVTDMSSSLLSAPLDVSKFGCIFACSQKNFGPAGITVVILREELIGTAQSHIPSMFNYQKHLEAFSMQNTPPVYAWYFAGLCFEWILKEGGLAEMEQRHREKAKLLYNTLDHSDFYMTHVPKAYRSLTNIPFFLADPLLEPLFLEKAKQEGLIHLKGHRLLGGIRASSYNAMPKKGIETLVEFMKEFQRTQS